MLAVGTSNLRHAVVDGGPVRKQTEEDPERDDLWRGSRLVILLAVALIALMIAVVLRAGESASRSGEDSEASLGSLAARDGP